MGLCKYNCANCNAFKQYKCADGNGKIIYKNTCWSGCSKRILEYGFGCNRHSNDRYDASTSINACRFCGNDISINKDINKPYSMLFCSDECFINYINSIENNIKNVIVLIKEQQGVIVNAQEMANNLSFNKLTTNKQSKLLSNVNKAKDLIEYYKNVLKDLEFLKMFFYENLKGNNSEATT